MERIPTINKRALGKEFAPYVSGHAVGRRVLLAAREKVSELFGELLEDE
jgi:hypothetical protein